MAQIEWLEIFYLYNDLNLMMICDFVCWTFAIYNEEGVGEGNLRLY